MMSLVRGWFGAGTSTAGSVKEMAGSLDANNVEPISPRVGHMGNGTSVEQVEQTQNSFSSQAPRALSSEQVDEEAGIQATWRDVPDSKGGVMTLENINVLGDHYELMGQKDGSITYQEDHVKSSSWSERAYHSVTRSQDQQEKYRQGITNVRTLLLKKYDQHAVDRFDKDFSYRVWAGKPLTVRALKAFLAEEDQLRETTLNISKIGGENTSSSLEHLQASLNKRADDHLIIGSSKTRAAAMECWTPFLPIKRSYFSTAAKKADQLQGEKDGIQEAQRIIQEALSGSKEHTKTHVAHLFKTEFADNIKTGTPLKVSQLRAFIADTIKIRNDESGVFGNLHILMEEVSQEGSDVAAAVSKFVQGSYHALGVIAGASIILDQSRNTSDPIALALKGIFASGVVASETDTERILTAAILHFVATPAAAQPSITSKIIKFFVPFY